MTEAVTRRRTLVTLIGGVLAPAIGCRGKGAPNDTPAPVAKAPAPAKILKSIRSRSAIDGNGATVQRVFPSPELEHLDPFVLLDDFNVRAPAGFPEHPHRGFEAFTYMIEGAFHHRDNLGNDSMIGAGGTQRFNSGRGARHSEMPGEGAANRGLQLWVNLPRRKKKMEPEYDGIAGEDMPVQESSGIRLRTVVGEQSPVALHTEVEYYDVEFTQSASFETVVPEHRNTLLYALSGDIVVGETRVPRGEGVLLGAGNLVVHGEPNDRFAFLSGHPHDEPILHRGPFVD